MIEKNERISVRKDGRRVIIKKPELLAPAGSLEKLKIAVRYGADAVFIGGREYGLRSSADNFSFEEMKEGVAFAKKYGAKIYVTTNIYAHNENIPGLEDYILGLQAAGIAGIIVADPLIIETCRKIAPEIEVHLSTQQSLTNWKAAQFWKEEGLERVVLARETSAEEIREIKEKVDIEVETFIHGAMCIAYSGRCALSNHMTARDSNRGGCCQSCRWSYHLYEQTDVTEDKPLFTADDAPFAMSSKDLNLLQSIPKMIELGIDSLKIEGRMKSIHYIATVVTVYRKVIDAYCADPDNFVIRQEWIDELDKCANRETAAAFFEGVPQYTEQIFGSELSKPTVSFAGLVLDYDEKSQLVTLQQRNYFENGDTVEFFGPHLESFSQVVEQIWDEDGQALDAARHPLQVVTFKIKEKVSEFDMMRR